MPRAALPSAAPGSSARPRSRRRPAAPAFGWRRPSAGKGAVHAVRGHRQRLGGDPGRPWALPGRRRLGNSRSLCPRLQPDVVRAGQGCRKTERPRVLRCHELKQPHRICAGVAAADRRLVQRQPAVPPTRKSADEDHVRPTASVAVAVTVTGRSSFSPAIETVTGRSSRAVAALTVIDAPSARPPSVHATTPAATTTLTTSRAGHRATRGSYPPDPVTNALTCRAAAHPLLPPCAGRAPRWAGAALAGPFGGPRRLRRFGRAYRRRCRADRPDRHRAGASTPVRGDLRAADTYVGAWTPRIVRVR